MPKQTQRSPAQPPDSKRMHIAFIACKKVFVLQTDGVCSFSAILLQHPEASPTHYNHVYVHINLLSLLLFLSSFLDSFFFPRPSLLFLSFQSCCCSLHWILAERLMKATCPQETAKTTSYLICVDKQNRLTSPPEGLKKIRSSTTLDTSLPSTVTTFRRWTIVESSMRSTCKDSQLL